MKKKLSYRDKLLELAYIYNVKEIKEYVKNKKNLTTGQLELVLKKNNIAIPKDYKTSFVKENFFKPISKMRTNILDFRDNQIKATNKLFRKTENFKYDTQRKIGGSLKDLWKSLGIVGLNFLNIIPTLGQTFYRFFADILTDLFNGIYNQKINPKNAKVVIISLFTIIGITTILVTNLTNFENMNQERKIEVEKPKSKIVVKKEKQPKNQIKKKKED